MGIHLFMDSPLRSDFHTGDVCKLLKNPSDNYSSKLSIPYTVFSI